jgi:endonuclease-8
MTGSWGTYHPGQHWRRGAHRAWLVLRTGEGEAVQFDGPVLELLTDSRTRFDRRLAELGPDILAPELDEQRFLRRLREDDPTRPIGDALLDQRTIAGIGNLWKCEGCFAAGIDPWRPAGSVSDDEALAVVRATRPGMQRSASDGMQDLHRTIYGRPGRPCPRCGAPIRSRSQGDDNRITYWCAGCQE